MNKSRVLIHISVCCVLTALMALVLPVAAHAGDAMPCSSGEYRQFDYWLGNWSVSNGGANTGTSKVELSLDQCLIVESWAGARNHVGKKIFAYSPEDHRWYGMFADNEGRVHVFSEGKVMAGSAEFQGPSRGPNGETVLNRMKIVRTGADRVEETWEKSSDSGVSWKEVYRGEYSRK